MDNTMQNHVSCDSQFLANPTTLNFKKLLQDFERRTKNNKLGADLNDLLLWLQKDFVPVAMFESRALSPEQVKLKQTTLKEIDRELSKLNKFFNVMIQASVLKNGRNSSNKTKYEQLMNSKNFDQYIFEITECEQNESIINHEENALVNGTISELDNQMFDHEQPSTSTRSTTSILTPVKPCCVKARERANFKFCFNIPTRHLYNPLIEKLVYGNASKFKISDEGSVLVNLPFVQFVHPSIFYCLVCSCVSHNRKSVEEHVKGNKHAKKINDSKLKVCVRLNAYHQMWKLQETNYQAHQVFFYSVSEQNVNCKLCRCLVSLTSLKNHIDSQQHRNSFYKYGANEVTTPLFLLQQLVFVEDEAEQQQLLLFFDKLNKESKTKEKHKVVISVANPRSSNLKDILEYRFYPDIKLLEKNEDDDLYTCKCCNVKLKNSNSVFREHILSKIHQGRSGLPKIQKFYCEVCALSVADNDNWMNHLENKDHLKRCNYLPSNRYNSLRECQCLQCNEVLFTDQVCLVNHTELVSLRGNKIQEELMKNTQELFKSLAHLKSWAAELVLQANEVVTFSEETDMCIRDIENTIRHLSTNCKAYPFGSRISGLGNHNSDLDVYIDVDNTYFGSSHRSPHAQEKMLIRVANFLRKQKSTFDGVRTIAAARTPIIQFVHLKTSIDCDLSFKHGLSVENTKFIRFCIKLQPVTQQLILVLKNWAKNCSISDSISTYALAMMVIFYLQTENLLLPVSKLNRLSNANIVVIDGWSIMDFTDITTEVRQQVELYTGNLKTLLVGFFNYYHNFDFLENVVCPLVGHPVNKILFTNNGERLPTEMFDYVKKIELPDGEWLLYTKPICVQDPFDLSHNLTKACSVVCSAKFKLACDLCAKYIQANCT